MLTPEYLASCTDYLLKLYGELEDEIIRDIARRIVKTGVVTATAEWQANQLQEMGALQDQVIEKVARSAGKTQREIRKLFQESAIRNIETNAEPLISHGIRVSRALSPAMREVLKAAIERTAGNIRNLTMTTGSTSGELYLQCSNDAYMKAVSGAFSPQEAIYQAVKKAGAEGATVQFATRKDKLDVAIRRNVMTSVNQTAGRITVLHAADLGAEFYETSAHPGARPTHAEWQGQVFQISGSSRGYQNFYDATGYGEVDGLCGVNCRHSFYPFFPEFSERAYSDEKLQEYADQSVEYNGARYSYYESSQIQRKMERSIRESKRELAAIDAAREAAEDEETAKLLDEHFRSESVVLKEKEARLKDFLQQTGRDAEKDRVRVPGFNKSVSQKSVWANRNRASTEPLANGNKSGTIRIEDTTIFRTLSARAKNYDVEDKSTGIVYKFVEGTKIQNSEVFAGYKTHHPLNEEVAKGLSEQIGGIPEKWQHCKGVGVLDVDGEHIKAEVHWFQEESVGKHKFKVKEWFDDEG